MTVREAQELCRAEQDRLNARPEARKFWPREDGRQPGETLTDFKQRLFDQSRRNMQACRDEQNSLLRNPREMEAAAAEWERDFFRTRWRRRPAEIDPDGPGGIVDSA